VTTAPESLSAEITALQAALAAERTARQEAEARASGAEAMVAHLKLLIAKLRRDQYGQSSERGRKLLNQLELQLEEAAGPLTTAWRRAGGKVGLLLPISKNGCARSVPTCRVATISPRPWTTYSSAGRLSPGSSTTAASASARVVLRSQNRRLGADFLGCLLQASTIRS
jgi:Transposase C of IS166 homeodomain